MKIASGKYAGKTIKKAAGEIWKSLDIRSKDFSLSRLEEILDFLAGENDGAIIFASEAEPKGRAMNYFVGIYPSRDFKGGVPDILFYDGDLLEDAEADAEWDCRQLNDIVVDFYGLACTK